MHPCAFDEENAVLDAPKGMSPDECSPLSVWRGRAGEQGDGMPVVVSCWKPTAEELETINRTGRVWLVVCGDTMPPVEVSGIKPFHGGD